jgi:hypothetical protein
MTQPGQVVVTCNPQETILESDNKKWRNLGTATASTKKGIL